MFLVLWQCLHLPQIQNCLSPPFDGVATMNIHQKLQANFGALFQHVLEPVLRKKKKEYEIGLCFLPVCFSVVNAYYAEISRVNYAVFA
jgi:hypothetical protein